MSETVIRTNSPADVLAMIPYQLGFTPSESAVVVSIRPSGRVGLIARVDLADLTGPHGDNLASTLIGHLTRDGVASHVVATYTDLPAADADEAARLVTDRLDVAGIGFTALAGSYLVTSDSWRALGDDTEHPVADLAETRTAAHMTFLGHAPQATREDLAAVTPAPARDRAAATRAARTAAEAVADFPATARGDAWRSFLAMVADPSTRTPVALGRLVGVVGSDVIARDVMLLVALGQTGPALVLANGDTAAASAAMGAIFTGAQAPDGDHVHAACDVLRAMVAHTTDPGSQVPARTILALAAWYLGDGAAANTWIESLPEGATGTYTLAALVAEALDAGMPPGWVRAH